MTNIILYETPQGKIQVEVRFENDTFWLTQKAIAVLFGVDRTVITKHLKNIFETDELDENSVSAIFAHTAQDDKIYQTTFYNLDAVIAVGYRVNSKQATQFRIWATQTIKEFVVKGFILDDERLKQGKNFGKDYFDELLARIRDIRASEKRFYQKIKDLFTLCDDYDTREKNTQIFFAEVQNKLLYAVTQHTAPEIIVQRAKADFPNMGLSTWKGSRVRKEDIFIAKNYLSVDEIDILNRMVSIFLDVAELRVKENIKLTMDFWKKETDKIIDFSHKPILNNAGKIGTEQMKTIVTKEYDKFDSQRKKIEAQQTDNEELQAIEKLYKKAKNKI